MIIDKLLELSCKQTLSAAAASENTVDFGQTDATTGMDHGRIAVVFTVNEDVTGNLTFKLQDSANNSDFADIASAVSGVLSSPKAGTRYICPMPYHHKQYVRAYYAGAPTAGKVSANIVWGWEDNVPPAQAPSHPVGQ